MGGGAALTTNTTAGREAAGRARGWCRCCCEDTILYRLLKMFHFGSKSFIGLYSYP